MSKEKTPEDGEENNSRTKARHGTVTREELRQYRFRLTQLAMDLADLTDTMNYFSVDGPIPIDGSTKMELGLREIQRYIHNARKSATQIETTLSPKII